MAAETWIRLAESRDAGLVRSLTATYNSGTAVVEDRCRRLASMGRAYIERFGSGPVSVYRAPGRVNLMGRHIDHQGGYCNMMALEADIYVMGGIGAPRRLRLHSTASDRFPHAEVDLDHALDGYTGGSWEEYVTTPAVQERVRRAGGVWSGYAVAALARISAECPAAESFGLDAVVAGNVPVAAGLSSSSAVVVAIMEAIVDLAGLELTPERFVTLCAEAEWYVGTRGGAGDQAAMRFARPGHVIQLGFHPLNVERAAAWPNGYALLVANSGLQARKSDGARNRFNQRVACYHIGREILLRRRPELRDRVERLRDLAPSWLNVPDAEVAEMLLDLPIALERHQISDHIGAESAERLLSTHDCGGEPYPIRSVVLFGLSECERSRRCADLLARGAVAEIGRMMNVSHDGDRVSSAAGGWAGRRAAQCSDADVRALAMECRNGRSLADQPGAYGCSTQDIDAMADILLETPGVLGAQLSGAGLGGCLMALVQAEQVDEAHARLVSGYYAPRGLEPETLVCRPAGGCGPILP